MEYFIVREYKIAINLTHSKSGKELNKGWREDYRIQVNATHAAADSHHGGVQHLIISFNQPVHYSFCNANGASLAGGDGTNTLDIGLTYHQNGNDNIGFGDLVVTSEPGLAITGAVMTCNHDCGQH